MNIKENLKFTMGRLQTKTGNYFEVIEKQSRLSDQNAMPIYAAPFSHTDTDFTCKIIRFIVRKEGAFLVW